MRIEALFSRALELARDERPAFLDRASAGQPDLRAEVEALLEQHDSAPGVLDGSPAWLAPEEVPAEERLPSTIGPYRVVRVLGRGGMGQVYLAEREEADVRQLVAIKVMRAGLDTDDLVARFRNERRILARLDHPNIARLFDVGATAHGPPYFVLEYVDGEPLVDFCDRRKLTLPERLRLFETICAAVHYAHRALVVHRDIKPHNILVNAEGVPKLLDFGIAKLLDPDVESAAPLTRTNARLLTPEYSSPEQVRGDPVTTSCDVYALGVLLYELLAGTHPYAGRSGGRATLERLILEVDPAAPSASVAAAAESAAGADRIAAARGVSAIQLRRQLEGDLDTVALKAMRKEPEARYASALELAEDVERHLAGHPVRARPATLRYRALKFALRNRLAVSGAAALFLVLAASTAITLGQSRRIRLESERVTRERDKALQVRSLLLEMFGTTGPDQPTGDAVTARQLLDRQAGAIDVAFDDDPEMRAEMLDVLAEGYEKLGLLEQAEPLARRALEVRRALFGERHPDLVVSLNVLGWLLHERGQLDEADTLLREAVAVGRAVFPEEGDARLARALNDLGNMRSTRGNFDEAAALFRESIDMRRRLLGDEHIGVAIATSNLSVALYRDGEIAGGVREGRAALDLFRRVLGPDHQRTITVQANLAAMQGGEGDHEGAAREHRDILERRKRLFGARHPTVAASLTLLANDLMRLGRDAEAEPLLVEALAILRSAQGARPIDVAATLRVLGDIKARGGRNLEALRDFRAGLTTLRRTTGERHAEGVVLLSR
ncbi:MAG: protein kinase domain-containing protein, partial [Longimicrobiales bacterium]